MYSITYADRAAEDLAKLKKNEPKSFQKAVKLLNEIAMHPRTGTGHPEQLKGARTDQWSRRITQKHRLIYEVHDTEIVVLVLAAYGHYEDK
ncbi:MAG: Txe/YoeB family addiction module toxin [Bacteroidales bacterium]|nr:Txe/YoeB family addiction module toxin [Bacteroidales bacterium]